jgi:hypothetical protein
MKYRPFSLVALGAAVLVSGCVVYPVGGHRDGGDRNGYYNDGDRRDCRDRRDCGRHERDGDRRDERGDRP